MRSWPTPAASSSGPSLSGTGVVTATDGGSTGREGSESSGAVDSTGDESTGRPIDDCGAGDEPDLRGLDTDGDGIDGSVPCSVFVDSSTGDDTNDGLTMDTPVATLSRGIELAADSGSFLAVLVTAGTYEESVSLASGVGVYGGYASGTWTRDFDPTIIQSNESPTVAASALTLPTRLQALTIRGPNLESGGQASIAVLAVDIDEGMLSVDACTIEGGQGGDGEDGFDGAAGGDGSLGGDSACGIIGGNRGTGNVCPSTPGDPSTDGGPLASGGLGGAPGISHCDDECNDVGTDGTEGSPGTDGPHGVGGTAPDDSLGAFDVDAAWLGPLGNPATVGGHGGGGGGGGAGGHDDDLDFGCATVGFKVAFGGPGGIGGGGGCGGEAETSGTPGGASIGLVAVRSFVIVDGSSIVLGTGGAGGHGGHGGHGGVGGNGSPGASGFNDGGDGADGGDGGVGGGAGGCGGAAIGFARVGFSSVMDIGTDLSGGTTGAPGLGGSGGTAGDGQTTAPAGADGCPGLVEEQAAYP
ncbi:MAG: hypothetical protein AAF799_12290 [Myxococcota bacterium]